MIALENTELETRTGDVSVGASCFHCGLPCPDDAFTKGEKSFCCQGCMTVFEILSENGLGRFYDLAQTPGNRREPAADENRFTYLNDESVRRKLLDFTDGKTSRVTFQIPSIHCVACVWLLENLFRIREGIGQSQVNFPRKELTLSFRDEAISLGEVVQLLASLGYGPVLNFGKLDSQSRSPDRRKLYLQIGLAGFAFGNTMMMSLSSYFGFAQIEGAGFQSFFGWLSIFFSLPVLVYSASDYWKAAWLCLRRRILTIDFPIALGIVALFVQSLYEIVSGVGEGYLDSFTGLVFFLLCGKLFQRKTYDRLSFDQDYKAFFPLSVIRKPGEGGETTIPISKLEVGDRLVIRNQELVPADAVLASESALIDYSFVTGESDPVAKKGGDYLYAGGRQIGGAIEVRTAKEVSQSYLTSLWNQKAFQKHEIGMIDNLTDRFSRYFTPTVISVAVLSACFWLWRDATVAVRAFTSVLIVACPCALALSAPFALGTAQRILGKRHVFLKNAGVLERLSKIRMIVFDKTGTLTSSRSQNAKFVGKPMTSEEANAVRALARHSTHPLSQRIAESLNRVQISPEDTEPPIPTSLSRGRGTEGEGGTAARTVLRSSLDGSAPTVIAFEERAGLGVRGMAEGRTVVLGSSRWLEGNGISAPKYGNAGSIIHLAIDGKYRGHFLVENEYRPEVRQVIEELSRDHRLALITGDNSREKDRLTKLFGPKSHLGFEQSPMEKLEFIRSLQRDGNKVMMVGDGLNDAGALKQSDVGVAVSENIGTFSPASDIILDASRLSKLPQVLRFAKDTRRVIIACIIISVLYNIVGISFAARGMLSPVLSAILMPLSSVTVVSLAVLATWWFGRKRGKE